MPIVIDASICSSWIIPDEQGPAEQLMPIAASDYLVVPGHFWFEIRNVLVMNERRKRMTPTDVADALTQLSMFDWMIDTRPDENRILSIARQFSLTFMTRPMLPWPSATACPSQLSTRPC